MKTVLFTNYRASPIESVVPFIRAKYLEYTIVMLHPQPTKVPDAISQYVDYFIIADPNDNDAAITAIKSFHNDTLPIDAAFTWTDRDVVLVAQIGAALGLPLLPVESAINVRNKYKLRQAIKHLDVCPKFQAVSTLEELQTAVENIGFPAIFKPVGASGSKAIFRIDETSDLKKIFSIMQESTNPKSNPMYAKFPNQYIYESYLSGQEISVDGLVHNGEVYILGITDKEVSMPWSFETKGVFPSSLSSDEQSMILTKATEVIKALNLFNAPFHLEARYSKDDGFKVLECAGRAAGGFMSTHAFPIALGGHDTPYPWVDRILQGVSQDSNFKPDIPEPVCSAGNIALFATEEGRVKQISVEALKNDNNISVALANTHAGENMSIPPKNFSPMIATIVAYADNSKMLHEILDEASLNVQYISEPNIVNETESEAAV